MLALIGNLDMLELVVIAAFAVILFGKRLPEVAMRGAAQMMKLRREVARMWREAGLEEELRKVRRDIEREVPRHLPTPEQLVREAERELEEEQGGRVDEDEEGKIEPEDAFGPLDPLAREALSAEPGADEPGDADPIRQARLEPQADEEDDEDASREGEKESA